MSPRGAQFYLCSGGDERDRTDDPLLAKQVLSQLSYTPIPLRLVLYLLERTSKIKQRLKVLRLTLVSCSLSISP